MENIKSGLILNGNIGDVVEAIAKALNMKHIGEPVPVEHTMAAVSEILKEMANKLEKVRFDMGAVVCFCKAAGFPEFQKSDEDITEMVKQAIGRHDLSQYEPYKRDYH